MNPIRYALFGNGKTGSEVHKLLNDKNYIGPFNSKKSPSINDLEESDVAIVFVPGVAMNDIIPQLIEAKIHAVIGATGFEWPKNINEILVKNNLKWIHGRNFSLGMQLIKTFLNNLNLTSSIQGVHKPSIHEVHHTKKLDAPSGTAKMWQEWSGMELPITSERTEDVFGYHEFNLENEFEKITISHNAKNRQLFASGAIFAADNLMNNLNKLPSGITSFDQFLNLLGDKK